ncbi:glycosyltransferase, partial [Bacteroides fragilis]
ENDRTEEEKYIYDEYKQEVSFYRKVDRIICLAQYTKMLLNEFYGIEECKLTLIYNGLIDQAIFLDEVERMQRKRDLFFGEGEKLILFVGRLDDIKGVDYLIEAFAKVIKKSSNTRLLIVGDGNYSRYLQMSADIWSRITFIGK